MTRFPINGAWFALIAAGLALAPAASQDAKKDFSIRAVKAHGNVFGGEEVELKFRVDAAKAIKGRVAWRLALDSATIKAGEVAVNAAPNAPADVAIKLAIPEVKAGAVLQAKLTLNLLDDAQSKSQASYEQDLWIFPKDAFADRTEWLKGLKLHLFDPKGDTNKLLTAAQAPFEELRSVEAVEGVKEGLVIVGEGASFKEERGLAAALQKLAAGGVKVLVLAPAAGEVIVPGAGNPVGALDELHFRRDLVKTIDKRLDADGWPPDGKAVAAALAVKMGEEAVVGEIGPDGWPWVEARYGAAKGRWLFCGLAVVAKWEAGPTPRFLFIKMLEYLTQPEHEIPKKENE